jgi:hypothetical protein
MALSALAIAAIIAASAGATGASWNAIGSNTHGKDYKGIARSSNKKFDKYLEGEGSEYSEMWNSLPEDLRQQLVNDYTYEKNNVANLWGAFGGDREVLDYERMLQELADASSKGGMFDEYESLVNSKPVYEDYFNDALDVVNQQNQAEYDELDKLLDEQTKQRDTDLANISESYGGARRSLLSNQYRQNSQTMDTLQSGMDRTRRNALEAGASAGIRIAGNVNTLLSAQNKQAATSMDTANQLSQMMINQRNAESSVNRAYNDYLTNDNAQRRDLRMSTEDRAHNYASGRYNVAQDSYDAKVSDFDSKYSMSNMYDYKSRYANTKNSSGTTT